MAEGKRWARREVNVEEEKLIISNLITSTRYCRELIPLIEFDYFQIDYAKRIARWIVSYFKKYSEAPRSHIMDLYETEKKKIKEAESELISDFLNKLSDKYEEEDRETNVDYLVDKAVNYFTERSLLINSQEIQALVGAGKVPEAQKCASDYRKVARVMSRWVNPFDPEYITKVYDAKFMADEEERTDVLFRMSGELGKFLGWFERDWLIGIMGPMKRGKTWWLQEVGIQAVANRCKTALFSLEMKDTGLSSRIYHSLTALGDEEKGYIYPCFDCSKNQDGSCKDLRRTNRIQLLIPEGGGLVKPEFSEENKYRPCVECRGKNKQYKMATWFEVIKRKKRSLESLKSTIKGFDKIYHDYLRIRSYPAYSANIGDISRDLATLEYTDGFMPDVIIIDYADILAPESEVESRRDQIDETWKMLKNLAETRHCLVVTASQSTRATLEKRNVLGVDTAEDIRKLAHVDAMITLNQTGKEKEAGIMRIGLAAHRWKDSAETRQCTVLQQLSFGQVNLDSCV